MTPTPKIAALLATCIGAAWIGEQLGTILKQKDKAIGLLVSINSSIKNIILPANGNMAALVNFFQTGV